MSSQVTLTKQGAFDADLEKQINDMFTELYASVAGGTLASGKLLVGSSGNVATARTISGDLTIDNTGVAALAASIGRADIVTLSAADIIALHSAPKQIIAAPGVGFAIELISVAFSMTYGSVQFTGGGVVQAQYHTLTTNLLNSTFLDTSIKAAASFAAFIGQATTASGIVLQENKAVELVAAGADFAAGNSTAKAIVAYRTIAL